MNIAEQAQAIVDKSRARGREAARRLVTYAAPGLKKKCTKCGECMMPKEGETLSQWDDRKTHQTQRCRDKARDARPNTDLGRDAKPLPGLKQWGGGYCAKSPR